MVTGVLQTVVRRNAWSFWARCRKRAKKEMKEVRTREAMLRGRRKKKQKNARNSTGKMIYAKNITKEMKSIGVTPCCHVRYPKFVSMLRGKQAAIKRRTAIMNTFDDEIKLYELKMFDMEMSFFAPAGLTGREIYSICEEIFIEQR